MPDSGALIVAVAPPRLRRLKQSEVVRRGDWVEGGRQGFEPWEGPAGFRAGAFIKPIFRNRDLPAAGGGKAAL